MKYKYKQYYPAILLYLLNEQQIKYERLNIFIYEYQYKMFVFVFGFSTDSIQRIMWMWNIGYNSIAQIYVKERQNSENQNDGGCQCNIQLKYSMSIDFVVHNLS